MDKIINIQKKIDKMTRDTQGYNYKYFDINQILEKLLPLLHEEGLTLIQPLTNIDGRPAIETTIMDNGEAIISSTFPMPDLAKPQDMGSIVTYYRRYMLQSVFALEAEDDDASKVGVKKVSKRKQFESKVKEDYKEGVDPLADIV